MKNRSYNQIETTGPMGEKRQFPARVVCAEAPLIELWSSPFLDGVERSLSLKDVYPKMETLLGKFDGCYVDLTDMNYSIHTSLTKDKLEVGPNERVILSHEKEFIFFIRLDDLSRFFVLLQGLFIVLPFLLLVPKPIVKFVAKGKTFFVE